MKTWKGCRSITLGVLDEVEVEAETEAEARAQARIEEVSRLDADVEQIDIESVECVTEEDDPDADPPSYLPPKEQMALTGFEAMRPDYPRAS